jgi:predicted DNA-binding transcriptional regulator AlpA
MRMPADSPAALAERHLTPAQLAEREGVSLRQVRHWRATRTGPPFIRLGPQTVRYRLDDVERWERERRDGAA